jgi:sulfate adenylyltransferase subunit 1 (EFTu-like GTPase family)
MAALVIDTPFVTSWEDRRASLAACEPAAQDKPLLRFTTAGSVDDGKSTLIGRLLHDAHSVHDDHLEALRRSGVNRSTGPLDFSLLTDGLKAEREQGITIDVAYRHFATSRRRFLIADTPGHEQYTRNMATGASTADAAIILVDARHGLTAQSRRHAYVASLLGIRHLLIAVNKMDLVGWDREAFERVFSAWERLATKLPGVSPLNGTSPFSPVNGDCRFRQGGKGSRGCCFHVLPVSALEGDNVTARSARTPWYGGPTLLELLETIDAPAWDSSAPLRFAVQYVVRPDLDFRGYAGRIDSGRIRAGQRVTVLPCGRQTRVKRIVTFDGDLEEAFSPMAVTLVLEDDIDISRGDWICGEEDRPLVTAQFEAALVWMHEHPLEQGTAVLLQQGTSRVPARVREIVHRIDPETYQAQHASQLMLNEIALVRLETARALVLDKYHDNRHTGSFVLIDPIHNHTLGAGMVERAISGERLRRHRHDDEFQAAPVTPVERFQRHGHRPAVVVSRSPDLRQALERALFDRGATVAALETLPPARQIQELLSNGLILLAPPGLIGDLQGADWVEAAEATSIEESVRSVFRDLESRGVLVSRGCSIREGVQ